MSGNQWRFYSGQPDYALTAPPTDFEGDIDPESPSDAFVYTEKRQSLVSPCPLAPFQTLNQLADANHTVIYLPHSYFVTDHKQAWRESDEPRMVPKTAQEAESLWALEEDKRWKMRKDMFPDIRDDTIIFANWNQLYKVGHFPFAAVRATAELGN